MMATPEETAALDEVMQLMEAEPVESTTSTSLASVTNDDNVPAQQGFDWKIKRSHRCAANT